MASDSVRQIKEKLSIVDVVSPYVELHQAGRHFKGKSPFSSEKTPSFYVSPDRGMYYCFSSSQGGDMFTFVEAMEGVDFKGALKILAEKAGIELVPEDPKVRTERDSQYSITEEAVKFFESQLATNEEAMRYLINRSVTKETIKLWRLGYAPGPPHGGWRDGRNHLKQKGFSDSALEKAGLVKAAGTGKEPYDVFRDRVMFPIADSSGRMIAFSGRILTKDSEAPKYVNSPETMLFNKSEALYGYDKAKQGIRKFDFSLIVEGQFDVVLCHQAGYSNTVAVSGTALTVHHAGLLQRLSNRVVLALDADRAGIAAVKRAADLMLARGVDLKVAKLPEGKDPADLISTDPAEFKKIIGHATHVIEFLLEILKQGSKDERTYKLQARDEIVPYLLKIDSLIDREHFVGVIAEKLGSTTDAINLEVARLEATKTTAHEPAQARSEVITPAKEVVSNVEFRKANVLAFNVVAAELLEEKEAVVMKAKIEEIMGDNLENLRGQIDTSLASELLFTLETQLLEQKPLVRRQELIGRLSELKEIHIKETLRLEKTKLAEAEKNQDPERISSCMEAINGCQQKLATGKFEIDIFD